MSPTYYKPENGKDVWFQSFSARTRLGKSKNGSMDRVWSTILEFHFHYGIRNYLLFVFEL